MENEKMGKAFIIAILTSIRETARNNGETKTLEHIDIILAEIRKK